MADNPLELSIREPALSARETFWPSQKRMFLAGLLVLLAFALVAPTGVARAFVLASVLFYITFTAYKLALVYFSVASDSEIRIPTEAVGRLADGDLPLYSILVPLYREAESVGHLVSSLCALDYPREKLDVQLLLEEDDAETRAAVAAVALPPQFRVTLVPPSLPRTKPKACNIGLARAKGPFLVIYDAEDRPEPDQLKKAVIAFGAVPPEVVCLQCKLNFYNPRQNVLTRWFAAEYSCWFDLSLPGLSSLRAVIPLGGTSNHFVTEKLRDVRGWDAYNVTEDCDLGVRLYRAGFSTRMLDTTTWEEACSVRKYWISQRTRWIKGYMQTYLVHVRRPVKLARELGPANFVHFHLLIGGIAVCSLLNPIYWILALLWFVFRLEFLLALFPGYVFAMGALCLFAGNFAFVYAGALGAFRRGYFDIVKYALFAFPYWALMSFSGWRAFFQLFTAPFHWEKTRHGLSQNKT